MQTFNTGSASTQKLHFAFKFSENEEFLAQDLVLLDYNIFGQQIYQQAKIYERIVPYFPAATLLQVKHDE